MDERTTLIERCVHRCRAEKTRQDRAPNWGELFLISIDFAPYAFSISMAISWVTQGSTAGSTLLGSNCLVGGVESGCTQSPRVVYMFLSYSGEAP